jgi:multidrug resistance efflux pump
MSAQQKQNFDVFIKLFVAAMLTIIGFFAASFYAKAQSTHDSVIRLEEQVKIIKEDVVELGTDVKALKFKK